ncbi:histone deacetylase 2 isoform X1 [Cinnamomum micranthum f. kanehirae]|uniref:Histone deacetylase 2 isoform X1 n=1 Tax=Cinnamomum micranthum f. kanehirae TaxID=337451 RepID=A0A3S3NDP4_9MAGN|nr:histone deacetylase 2 isoform X1 [Cinnamomum micranthum f. kanehirae]
MAATSASSSSSTAMDAETLRRNRILSSKLYLDVSPSKVVPLIYSASYDISFLGLEKLHPFDSLKWGRICRFLITKGILDKNSIVEPIEASQDDLLVVHSESYLRSLKSSVKVSLIIEVPPVALLPNCLVQWKMLHPFRKQVGGTILAGKLAKERGWAINVGGGFHHCSGDRGGGFCAYADISLCIHYAFDFEAMRYIDQKVELVSGTTTNEYLERLDEALRVAEQNFDPELVVYNAGTDILDGDPLGRWLYEVKCRGDSRFNCESL